MTDSVTSAGTASAVRSPDGSGSGPLGPLRRARDFRFRTFSAPADADRVRRPTDVVLLVVAALTLVALSTQAPGPTALDSTVSDFLTETQQPLGWLWDLTYAALALWTVLVLLVSLVTRGRKLLFFSEFLALGIAVAVASLASELVGVAWTDGLEAYFDHGPPPVYSSVRVALAVAVLSTASAHLSSTWRKVGRWLIVGGSVAVVALGAAHVIGVLAGVCAGVIGATAVHLLLGSPLRHLSTAEIGSTMRDLGVDLVDLADRGLDDHGVDRVAATRADRRAVLVKVYGRDTWDNQLVVSLWRALMWRDDFTVRRATRKEKVEHEAAATLLAQQSGVAVVPVLAVGSTAEGDGYLVLSDDGPTAAASDDLTWDRATLRGLWRTVGVMHAARIAHGGIDASRLVVRTDGSIALTDFADAELGAPDDALARDVARLLVVTALAVGPHAAAAVALEVLGAARTAHVLPYVQTAALSRRTLRALEGASWSMDDLRAEVAAQAGVDVPELEQLRRVSWASTGKMVLVGVVIYGLWSVFSGISLDEVRGELSNASWGWIAAALLLSPIVQMPQAVSTIGACFRTLRFLPSLMLQYAVQFIALAIPSSAARVAMEIRFFQKIGVPAAGAVSISMVDSFSGFIIQIALLAVVILGGLATVSLAGSMSDGGGTSGGSGLNWEAIGVAATVLVVTFLVALLWPRFRSVMGQFLDVARDKFSEGRDALQVVRNPSKLLLMFGGNLVAQLMYAFMLGLCLNAFGYSTSFANLILINTFVSLFAGFMPVPGGVGVAEAGLTYGLVAVGVPESVAVSTAVSYRAVTFYLPPSWTWYGTRWLRAHDML